MKLSRSHVLKHAIIIKLKLNKAHIFAEKVSIRDFWELVFSHIGPASYLDKSDNGWIRQLLDFCDTARKIQTLRIPTGESRMINLSSQVR
jgi:hypothetical protein